MDPLVTAVGNISIMFSALVILWIIKQCILAAVWIGKKITEYDRYISRLVETDKSKRTDIDK